MLNLGIILRDFFTFCELIKIFLKLQQVKLKWEKYNNNQCYEHKKNIKAYIGYYNSMYNSFLKNFIEKIMIY